MSHKTIILALAVFLLTSFVSLSFIARNAKDPNFNKNWWVVSFVDIHDDSLNFTIDNHSNATSFIYTVTQDNAPRQTPTTLFLPKGASETITLDYKVEASHPATITVWLEETPTDTRSLEK